MGRYIGGVKSCPQAKRGSKGYHTHSARWDQYSKQLATSCMLTLVGCSWRKRTADWQRHERKNNDGGNFADRLPPSRFVLARVTLCHPLQPSGDYGISYQDRVFSQRDSLSPRIVPGSESYGGGLSPPRLCWRAKVWQYQPVPPTDTAASIPPWPKGAL